MKPSRLLPSMLKGLFRDGRAIRDDRTEFLIDDKAGKSIEAREDIG